MDSETKKKWMSESHDKVGKELKASMQAEAKKWRETSTTSTFGFEADGWLDEADARLKYKDKPDQLKSLLDCARKVMHPTRGVWVYEDLKVTSSAKESSTEGQRDTWTLSTESSRKATAKPKATPRVQAEGEHDEQKKPKKLSTANTKKLEKLKKTTQEAICKFEELLTEANGENVKDMIPQFAVKVYKRRLAEAKSAEAVVDNALETGESVDIKADLEQAEAAKTKTAEAIAALETQITQAKDAIADGIS